MDAQLVSIAQKCLDASFEGSMKFPAIVQTLIQAGFESYCVDFRLNTTTYYHSKGSTTSLALPLDQNIVTPLFDITAITMAIREAQSNSPGYTFRGFCEKITKAGCAGYMVSFLGKRAVYYGRTAEFHVEHFPQ